MTTEAGFLQTIARRGIPDQWQRLGWVLAYDGAISTHLVRAVREHHETRSAQACQAVMRLFDEKRDNLAEARAFLATTLADYDRSGRWPRLDAVVRAADVETVLDELRPHFGLHPFPVVIESVRFNLGYIREHGFREFYVMTDKYVARVEELTERGREAFQADEPTETFPPLWLFTLDLNSIEVPTHCDVCRLVITYAERALDTA